MSQAQRDAALKSTLGALPCTLLNAVDSGTAASVGGIAGAGAPQAALTAALQSLPAALAPANSIATIDGPYCDALNAIRPYSAFFPNPAAAFSLGLAGGKTTLHDGDIITVDQEVPAFAGFVVTDYFSSDGTVLHLNPQLKTGSHTLAQEIGSVSAPYGTDMIISIASSVPLFTASRKQVETDGAYLPDLRQALQNAVSGGAKVAVAAIPVNTLPK
jgi:serine/threonine-protein kinase